MVRHMVVPFFSLFILTQVTLFSDIPSVEGRIGTANGTSYVLDNNPFERVFGWIEKNIPQEGQRFAYNVHAHWAFTFGEIKKFSKFHETIVHYHFLGNVLKHLKNKYLRKCIPNKWTLETPEDFSRAFETFLDPKLNASSDVCRMSNIILQLLEEIGITKTEFIQTQAHVYRMFFAYIPDYNLHCIDGLHSELCELVMMMVPEIDPAFRTIMVEISEKI